ncbi:MAG: hypothetical protein WAK33_08240, partial [Silvibacterium sp.]
MSLAGGPADKLGNRYELWWTILKVMDILRGQRDAIRVEEPGVEKAEFVLRGALEKSLQQAKRQAGDGKWTLAELFSKDNPYLQTIGQQLPDPNTRIVFVSGSDAPELAELSTRARGLRIRCAFPPKNLMNSIVMKRARISAGSQQFSSERYSPVRMCDEVSTFSSLRGNT